MMKKTGIALMCMSLLCGCAGRGISFRIEDDTEYREFPDSEDFYQTDEYNELHDMYDELSDAAEEAVMRQFQFAKETSVRFFQTGAGENRLYAPLNAWFALAALAECSYGNTRSELLDLLNADSDEQLQQDYEALWNAAAVDLPETKDQNAVSLWLSGSHSYPEDRLQMMQEKYHLSSFGGKLTSAEISQELQNWINTHTGSLSENDGSAIQFKKDTVMSLISALSYKAAWTEAFDPKETKYMVFKGTDQDVSVREMWNEKPGKYYQGANFTAIRKELKDDGYMYFIRPDDGVKLQEVYEQDEMWQMMQGTVFTDRSAYTMLYHSIPVFSMTVQNDLSDLLKASGVTSLFDSENADFSGISDDNNLYMSDLKQMAMLSVGEGGLNGASYSEIKEEDMDYFMGTRSFFYADRPFIFAVTADNESLLLTGTVSVLPDVQHTWNGSFPGDQQVMKADHEAALPQGTIHYYLPEGMESKVSEDGELYLYMKENPDFGMVLSFDKELGLCGTGMKEEYRTINGWKVWLGSDTAEYWQYASFQDDKNPKLVIESNLAAINDQTEADQILHSIRIDH